MKKTRFFPLLLLAFLLINADVSAQKEKRTNLWKSLNTPTGKDTTAEDYYGDNAIRYEDRIYKKSIRTVELRDENFRLSQPILQLGSDEKLKLSFDDLDADLKNYSFSLIHCNANWEPSDLISSEYIDGFTDNVINDYRYSFNTLQLFTHYNAFFPNSSMRITRSGNYLLKVYADGNPENIVITRRFLVYDNKVSVTCRVQQASIIEDRNYKQELDFTILQNNYQISNPYNDLKIVITQNNRWDNMKTDLKPVFVKDGELVYDYDQENVFAGGNEFRFFDIKSIRYHSEKVMDTKIDSAGNQVILYPEEKRAFKRYYSQSDINGDFYIRAQDAGNNSEAEADYCYVHFFLPYDEVLTSGNLYVFGAYNSWTCNKENLMRYNDERRGYECTLLLKQGYYNYEYAFLKDGAASADETLVEGSHYETENDYSIYVYHRKQGTFYDQLIGVKHVNSMKD
jgi:hypothetical protein